MKTALILDDLPESRHWLEQALRQSFGDIAISMAESVDEARQHLLSGGQPEIALIDLGLPDGSGIEVIQMMSLRSPATLCIVASIFDDDRHVFPALRAGARGYLLKDQPIEVIVRALKGVAAGEPPISPAIARRMLNHFSPTQNQGTAASPLTERETEVLQLIAKGMTLVESARLLGISHHTVTGYVKEIYRKLNVSSRAEATLLAREMGLV